MSENAFDSASQRKQIAVATGGCIELETEWKAFCVHGHRQADSGNPGGVRRMRISRQKDVRHVLARNTEVPLIFDPRRRTGASNRSGIWDRAGVVFSIAQLPFFYQTRWSGAMIGGLVILLAVGVYRVRMHQISRAMSVCFDERLAERTRVARDLHDTLLQTVQGSKMVADTARDRPDDAPALARALQQVSTWLGQAGEEGRAAVDASLTVAGDEQPAFPSSVIEARGTPDVGRRESAPVQSVCVA